MSIYDLKIYIFIWYTLYVKSLTISSKVQKLIFKSYAHFNLFLLHNINHQVNQWIGDQAKEKCVQK